MNHDPSIICIIISLFFYIYKVLFLHPLENTCLTMLDLRDKEKTENIQFSLMLLGLTHLTAFKRVQFWWLPHFTDFEFDNIQHNMPYLCVPAYMMLIRKFVMFFFVNVSKKANAFLFDYHYSSIAIRLFYRFKIKKILFFILSRKGHCSRPQAKKNN